MNHVTRRMIERASHDTTPFNSSKTRTVRATKDEVIERYGLCAVCADRETCPDKPDDMLLSLCTSYSDDGSTMYQVKVRE